MLVSLGKIVIATPGVKLRATNNQTDPTKGFLAHSVLIEAWPSNTGKIYICDRSTANTTTGVGLLAILGIPTANFIPTFTDTISYASNGCNIEQIWIDADNPNDGVLVSVEEA